MLVEGLRGPVAASVGGAQLANSLATRWVETNLVAFQKSHFMFEKYDYEVVGKGGGGGEYKPQTGFGWTNGVVLSMIAEHSAMPM